MKKRRKLPSSIEQARLNRLRASLRAYLQNIQDAHEAQATNLVAWVVKHERANRFAQRLTAQISALRLLRGAQLIEGPFIWGPRR